MTFFEPTLPIPAQFVFTNVPDRFRDYNGVEFALTKRYSDRWMGTFSYAYNDAKDVWDSPASYEDPTNILQTSGAQFAPESGGSGIDNVFTNAKWLFKASGMYTLPLWDINLAGNFSARQGYPFPQAVRIATRANRATTVDVLLDQMGDVRLGNFSLVDLRIDKAFNFGEHAHHPEHGRVQPVELEHGAGPPAPPGGHQRQRHQRHRRAARHTLRREGDLVGGN